MKKDPSMQSGTKIIYEIMKYILEFASVVVEGVKTGELKPKEN